VRRKERGVRRSIGGAPMKKPHKRLRAWQLAMDIAVDVYKISKKLPSNEKYGLVSQMRRSAVSVPSNIAEGAGRRTKKEFIISLHIAQGSLSELDTQLELAMRLEYIDEIKHKELDDKFVEEDRVLSGLIKSQRN
jgi:four helix bundle protein